jgi:hypothetical protein
MQVFQVVGPDIGAPIDIYAPPVDHRWCQKRRTPFPLMKPDETSAQTFLFRPPSGRPRARVFLGVGFCEMLPFPAVMTPFFYGGYARLTSLNRAKSKCACSGNTGRIQVFLLASLNTRDAF